MSSTRLMMKSRLLTAYSAMQAISSSRGIKSEKIYRAFKGNKNLLTIILIVFALLIEPSAYADQCTKMSPVMLSTEQLNSFEKDGYLIVRNLFSIEEVSRINNCLTRALDKAKAIAEQTQIDENIVIGSAFRCAYEGNNGNSASIKAINNIDGSVSVQLISWIGGVEPELIELARQDKLKVPVSQLLGSSKADHLINQAHYKMPFDGVSFPWHQDIQHRRTFDPRWEDLNRRGSFVQVLTAVDRATEENGPLIVIKGSHRKELYLEKKQKEAIERIILEEYPNEEWTPILMEPGDTMFMHPLVLHKSDANQSHESRMLFVNGFSYPGANKMPYPGSGSAKTIHLLEDTATLQNLH